MKKNTLALLILALAVIVGCSSLSVTADYDKTVDFTQYKTYSYYGWTDNSDQLLSAFDKERLEKSFADEFEKRKITYVKENGDLTVALFIHTKQEQQTTATTTGMGGGYGGYGGYYGYGPGWGWGGGMATTTYNTYDYTVGTLVCDVYDTQDEKLIWEGVGKGTVSDNPQKREANIPKAVSKIMAQYPVQPVSVK
ncbi:MAG: DUF4136 domain-containing protein [Bacteroidota bacterium]|nr:DUF4136 domain-containing protein [Bacteroidota bacterium]